MLETKTTEVFSLSDDDKKVIKENAQKIKNYLVARRYNSCEDFIVFNDYDYYSFVERILEDFLPFVKKEIYFIDEDDAEKIVGEVDSAMKNVKSCITKDDFSEDDVIIDFLDDKYTKEGLIKKIIEIDNEEFLNILLNK